jgi:hypothetical protein
MHHRVEWVVLGDVVAVVAVAAVAVAAVAVEADSVLELALVRISEDPFEDVADLAAAAAAVVVAAASIITL